MICTNYILCLLLDLPGLEWAIFLVAHCSLCLNDRKQIRFVLCCDVTINTLDRMVAYINTVSHTREPDASLLHVMTTNDLSLLLRLAVCLQQHAQYRLWQLCDNLNYNSAFNLFIWKPAVTNGHISPLDIFRSLAVSVHSDDIFSWYCNWC